MVKWTVFLVAVFVVAVIVEPFMRSQFEGQMTIHGLPVANARVVGTWTPDFLWSGKAWRIEVQSEEDLELVLDGQVFVVPKGSVEVFSNQDGTNTGEFGSQAFWGYPERVEVRRAESF